MVQSRWMCSAVVALAVLVSGALGSARAAEAESAKVGGHLKFYTYDKATGDRNGVSQATNASTGFSEFIIFISKQLNEYLEVEAAPMIQGAGDRTAVTSATPVLGKNFGRPTLSVTLDMYVAHVTWHMPHEIEFKAGLLNAMYSEEYGSESFWYELYHNNNRICLLEAWHDSGIELYKNFDFSSISMPVYLYVLNGTNRYQDENETKSLLLHVAPELFNSRLSIPLSASIGRDASDRELIRNAAGVTYKIGKLTLGSEYFYRLTRNVALGAKLVDGEDTGYYAKALYRFNPVLQLVLKYGHVDLYNSKVSTALRKDSYDDSTAALGYYFSPSDMIILQYSLENSKVSDDSDKVNAQRLTLGWRITF